MRRLTLLVVACAMCVVVATSAPVAVAATCVSATNVQAILDDSGSMLGTDYNKLRAEALKLLINKAGNAKKTLGATEFGSQFSPSDPPAATSIFAPQLIGPNKLAMETAIDSSVDGGHGGTNYNAAFTQAGADNPNAQARIFLTDGGHNSGTYTNGHQGGPPTYVVGLGDIYLPQEDKDRLAQIAAETGGQYFANVTTANVQSIMNQIDAAINCTAIAQTFSDNFTKAGQTKNRAVRVGSTNRSTDIVLTWSSPLDQFTVGSIKLVTKNGTIASISKRRLRITRTGGKTFLNVHISGLKKGRLRFKLRARSIGTTGTPVSLTTQATNNRSR